MNVIPDDVRVIDEVAESLSEIVDRPHYRLVFFAKILGAAQRYADLKGKEQLEKGDRIMTEPEPNERLTPVDRPITRPEAIAIATRTLEMAEQQRDETAAREAGAVDDTSRDAEIARLRAEVATLKKQLRWTTRYRAVPGMAEEWSFLWAEYVNSNDPMTPKAAEAKAQMRNLIGIDEQAAEIARLKAEVEKLRDQIEFLRTMKCGKCGRLMPPDGDCYGCEVDRLKAEIETLKSLWQVPPCGEPASTMPVPKGESEMNKDANV